MIDSTLRLLTGFDVDSCCFAYDLDDQRVYSTPRGMRALTYGVNVADTQFHSQSYCQRLEKYAARGFAVGVPGLLPERIAADLFQASYIHVADYDLLLCLGPLTRWPAEMDIACDLGESTEHKLKIRASSAQPGMLINGLRRLIVLDQSLSKKCSIPKVAAGGRIDSEHTRCCLLSTGRRHEYLVLWGVKPSAVMDADVEADRHDEAEDYPVTPLARVYTALDEMYRRQEFLDAAPEEGWWDGGVMQRRGRSVCGGILPMATDMQEKRLDLCLPLHFVFDYVTCWTPFGSLRFVRDAAYRPPLQRCADFEQRYGLPRLLSFDVKLSRPPIREDFFENVY